MFPSAVQKDIARAAGAFGLTIGTVIVHGGGSADALRAGRAAAALALEGGTGRGMPVGRAADGRPLWPSGTTGSISHAGGVAIAVAGPAGRAIGVDLEIAGALPAVDAAEVLDDAEAAGIRLDPWPDRLATRVWSAKEAAFKAWSTALGGLNDVDPRQIHVELAPDVRVTATGSLADLTRSVGPLIGTSLERGNWVVSLVVGESNATMVRRPGGIS